VKEAANTNDSVRSKYHHEPNKTGNPAQKLDFGEENAHKAGRKKKSCPGLY